MKLFIFCNGDESVGLNSSEYLIECPFEQTQVDQQDLVYFKELQENVFGDFLDLKVKGIYDYELKDRY